jgi:hypothetical protein
VPLLEDPRTCPRCREPGISVWMRGIEAMPKKVSGRITCRLCKAVFRFRLSIGPRLLVALFLVAAFGAGVALIVDSEFLLGDHVFTAIAVYFVALGAVVMPYLVGNLGIGTLEPVDADRPAP